MKRGLVLEGGAMRGLFTAGVLDTMVEHGIEFDGIVGVSAGAAFGCNYKSKQIGRTLRYNIKYCNDPRYCSFLSLLKTGDMYGAKFCYHDLPEKLDIFDFQTFESNKTEFYIVCTNIETGEPVYHKMEKCDYDELEWMRASASMPLVSRVVEVGGKKMLDGGISDSIPLKYFESIGYDRNVVVLTQPEGYLKSKNKMISLIRLRLKKYPKLVDAMARRHEMYNSTLEYIWSQEQAGNILVLCPKESLPVNHVEHKAENLYAAYNMGKELICERLNEVIEFLK